MVRNRGGHVVVHRDDFGLLLLQQERGRDYSIQPGRTRPDS